jgi:hypothetical protein
MDDYPIFAALIPQGDGINMRAGEPARKGGR